MRIKEITLKKNFKIGLPNFSNMDVGVTITWEIGEKEDFDYTKGWDIINQQLNIQATDNDPSWIRTEAYKDKYKATVNIPKPTASTIPTT